MVDAVLHPARDAGGVAFRGGDAGTGVERETLGDALADRVQLVLADAILDTAEAALLPDADLIPGK